MMTLRKRIFIILSIVILLILAISLLLIVWGNKNKENTTPENSSTTTPILNQQNNNNIPDSIINDKNEQTLTVKTPTTEEMEKNAAKQTAKIFMERYGTYSTDLPFQNIKDVESIVTDGYWSQLSSVINDSYQTNEFIGVTVKAISSAFVSWDGNEASVNVGILETKEQNGQTTTTNKNAIVKLKKVDTWLVSGFSWE